MVKISTEQFTTQHETAASADIDLFLFSRGQSNLLMVKRNRPWSPRECLLNHLGAIDFQKQLPRHTFSMDRTTTS
ncbi:hypothetical protein CEXT_529381 [Caerostris extrusa]|uniref:Uncharacterized protein n=1 Tax=Caerostris extrusa TaxID=172846 RepID=A0AAV4SSC5_CAEEX|nr:hypothetical protein CEXT_529381 [Caerostris extrusa]